MRKRKRKKSHKMKTLTYLFFFLILSSSCFAISIGISPGKVAFNNLLRGGYAERTIKITTDSQENLTAHFSASEEISDWLVFETNSTIFTLSSSNPHVLKIKILPPNDTRSGTYSGKIDFITDYLGTPSGRAGGLVKAAVSMIITAQITDDEHIACTAGGFNFKDIEDSYPLEIVYTIINEGNVRLKPIIQYDIWDQLQENLITSNEFISDEILPTIERKYTKKIQGRELSIGQYWVEMSIPECNVNSRLSFSIVEKGGIIDKGKLEKVTGKTWAFVNEPVEIMATFHNTGPRIVTAKFKGTITDDNDKILEVIETDEIDVNSNEKVDFKHIFIPTKQGRFKVNGRVVYNKKLTFEQGTIINVKPNEEIEEKQRYPLLFLYLVLVITIIYLVRKIYKDKKENMGKN
jgi:hypothetical protein